jgi:hypothetical protein
MVMPEEEAVIPVEAIYCHAAASKPGAETTKVAATTEPATRYGWRCNDDCRSEQGRADTTEHIAFHHSDPPTIDVGCWPPPPRAKITTATNAG